MRNSLSKRISHVQTVKDHLEIQLKDLLGLHFFCPLKNQNDLGNLHHVQKPLTGILLLNIYHLDPHLEMH